MAARTKPPLRTMGRTHPGPSGWHWGGALVLCFALALTADWFVKYHEAQEEQARILQLAIQDPVLRLSENVHKFHRQVRFLARVPPIQGIIRAEGNGGLDPEDGSSLPNWRDRLQQIYAFFLETHPVVDKARFIGTADGGRELVRVDRLSGRVRVTPSDELQRKGERDFFKAALHLPSGEVHVSDFNLNQEHGRVELPARPQLRLSTPIYDDRPNIFGAVVVNLNADKVLQPLQAVMPGAALYMCNRDGDFLIHPDPKRSFGFELGKRHRWQDEFKPAEDQPDTANLASYQRGEELFYGTTRRVYLEDTFNDAYVDIRLLVPSEAVLARARQALFWDSVILAVTLLLVSLLAYLYLNSRRMRRAAEEWDSRLGALVTSSSDAIIGVDTAGRVTAWNPAAQAILDCPVEHALGRPLSELLGTELPKPPDTDANAGNSVAAYSYDFPYHCGTDTPRLLSLTSAPIRLPGGQEIGRSILLRDITEIRNNEARIRQSNVDLEREVAQRTASLEQARTEAEAAAAAKGQFLAKMTHELRTPMNAVLGTLQLLHRTPLSGAQRRYAHIAETATRALLSTINDILDYSKIQAGKLTLYIEPFDLRELLREIGAVLSATTGSKAIDVAFWVDPNIPMSLTGDALRLQQVLMNLTTNALKFTESGYVLLTAQQVPSSEGTVVTFMVKDTGIGMSAEQLGRVFGGFEQAESSTTRRFGGSGLGLSIAQYLVDQMGGTLEVRSFKGLGSEFSFTVHFGEAEDAGTSSPPISMAHLTDLRLLIMDQPGTPRDVLEATVRSMGWTVECVATAAQTRATTERMRSMGRDLDIVMINGQLGAEAVGELWEAARTAGPGGRPPRLIVMAAIYAQSTLIAARPELEKQAYWIFKPATSSQLYEGIMAAYLGENWSRSAIESDLPPAQRLGGMRLLLAEDNRMNQQIAVELLEEEGAVVDVVYDGLQAVTALKENPDAYDAVLMDIHMPNLDGLDATRAIRKELGLTQLPIIAMTANATRADRASCIAAGMNDHVGKPFYVEQLIERLRRHTGRQRSTLPPPLVSQAVPKGGKQGPPAIDMAEPLARVDGRKDLLARTIRSFCSQYEEMGTEWEATLAENDPPAATRVRLGLELHNLKGMAATVGANRLSALAAKLESQLSEGASSDSMRSALTALVAALQEALEELPAQAQKLETAEAAGSAPGTGEVTKDAPLGATLDAFLEALAAQNMRALDLYSSLRTQLVAVDPALVSHLDSALRDLDFVVAHARLVESGLRESA